MTTTSPRPLLPRVHRQCTSTASVACWVVATAYVGTVVTANWASTHWPALVLGPLAVPAGTMWAGVTFTLRDLLHEALGARGVVAGIMVGTGVSWLLATPQIAVASMTAFAVSEILDSAIYAKLRHQSRLRAVTVSNLAALLVDSLLFVPLAFGSLTAVPGQLVGKIAATVLTLLLLRLRWRSQLQAVRR